MLRLPLSCASFIVALFLAIPLMAAPVDRRQQLAGWLTMLGDRDPHNRSLARQNLMSVAPEELAVLREIIAAAPHLTPAQADPLESIVTYISTRQALREQPSIDQAFLGISFSFSLTQQSDHSEQPDDVGVTVVDRLFGFVAYSYLEDGDTILAMGGKAGPMMPTRTDRELRTVVHTLTPGQVVTISLIRGGVLMRVQFPLDVAPQLASQPLQLEASINQSREEAQAYWIKQFRSLVDPDA